MTDTRYPLKTLNRGGGFVVCGISFSVQKDD
jgi:hypothetical protein